MKIINKTQFSTKLIKRIMSLALIKADSSTLVITHDIIDSGDLGSYRSLGNEGAEIHTINVTNAGDIITLGHELRHLAQGQRLGRSKYNVTKSEVLENDAELFEAYLLTKGY